MQRTVSLSTAILIAIVVGVVSYTLGSDYGTGTPRGSEPCEPCNGSSTPILTIRRTDGIPDFAQHIDSDVASTSKMMGFAITNHSTSTTYDIRYFYIFPGIRNNHAPSFMRNIHVFHDTTLIARLLENLTLPEAQVSTSTPLLIPPGTSQNFSIFGRVIGSFPTSTAQIAIGGIYAVHAGRDPIFQELVYKESNGVPLAPPASTTDESLESAVFLIP